MIVIYHANCQDGFTAAWIAHMKYPDATFIAAQYGDSPPEVGGDDVILVDFSYPRPVLEAIKKTARSLVVLDHHKTAEAALKGLDYCKFDMSKCGARLAWEFFFTTKAAPKLVDYVEDRDLWKWALPQSREVSAYLATLPNEFYYLDDVNSRFERGDFNSIAELGAVALRVVDKYVAAQVSRARKAKIGGYEVPCINTTFAISELVGELAEGEPFASGWFQRDDGRFVYSLRARGESSVDVSSIARDYGGGGHARAAGFTVDTLLSWV